MFVYFLLIYWAQYSKHQSVKMLWGSYAVKQINIETNAGIFYCVANSSFHVNS